MKRLIVILAVIAVVLLVSGPVLAASLGISPPDVEVEVPATSSATVDIDVYYYTGDIEVSLVDIPLKVEPDRVQVDSSDDPEKVRLTIYGDESLGSRIYNGYIRFVGVSGDTVAIAVKTKATVTNLVDGETPVLATSEEVSSEETVGEPSSEETTQEQTDPGTSSSSGETADDSWKLIVVAIAAGTILAVTLIIALARRPRYR